jgi:hypothetical protein
MNGSTQLIVDQATAECVRSELARIGNTVNVWRFKNEPLRNFSHRIALELEASIAAREEMLAIVLSLQKHPICKSTD